MDLQNNQKIKHETAVVNPDISIISLNVNKLNSPIERHRMTGSIDIQDTFVYLRRHISAPKANIESNQRNERLYCKQMITKKEWAQSYFHQTKYTSSQKC